MLRSDTLGERVRLEALASFTAWADLRPQINFRPREHHRRQGHGRRENRQGGRRPRRPGQVERLRERPPTSPALRGNRLRRRSRPRRLSADKTEECQTPRPQARVARQARRYGLRRRRTRRRQERTETRPRLHRPSRPGQETPRPHAPLRPPRTRTKGPRPTASQRRPALQSTQQVRPRLLREKAPFCAFCEGLDPLWISATKAHTQKNKSHRSQANFEQTGSPPGEQHKRPNALPSRASLTHSLTYSSGRTITMYCSAHSLSSGRRVCCELPRK
mmetsp:Transcript_15648/g.51202  ORF Transcript_15648/g.51202 Transcript_15648/m.51202 type:complete len:275 (+) Transcript_15648:391-1215(+)